VSTAVQETTSEQTKAAPGRSVLRQQIQQLLAFASLIALVVFFSVANENFLSWSNISGVLLSTTVIGILAVGTTFVIITGGIDLSIGTGMTLCAVMTGVFLTNMGLPLVVGVLGGVLTGSLLGLVNGINVAVLGIPPFIYFSDVAGFNEIALGSLVPGVRLPNAVYILFLLAAVGWVLLSKSIIGRYTFSIGSNEEATKISGIDVRKWKILIYTLAGTFTGVAGVVIASRLNSAQPALGLGYELEAIAAVVIGGTSLQGGKGSIVGTLIGALIMSVLTNGLRIMSIAQEWQTVVVGLVILLAVWTDILRRGKEA
jgi:ribose transport system permease protein